MAMANKHVSTIVVELLREGVKPVDNTGNKYSNPHDFVYDYYEQELPLIRDAEGNIISGHFRACFYSLAHPICNFNITALDVSKIKTNGEKVIIDTITFI